MLYIESIMAPYELQKELEIKHRTVILGVKNGPYKLSTYNTSKTRLLIYLNDKNEEATTGQAEV
jgi:hypothetical protein